jgi:flagellar hook assembly protein FlgD
VHDVTGRLIRTVRRTASAAGGFGTMAWDGRDAAGRRVPDGFYFLHLEGAGLDDARPITLLR